MPRYLRKDTVRLFEASTNMLFLAIAGLGLPRRFTPKDSSATYSSEIGLIGASAELAMAACIVQVYGQEAMRLRSGHFKSGSEILEDFRRLLRQAVPRRAFMMQDIPDHDGHRQLLETQTKNFRTVISARAGGLHAGFGPSREVCVVLARDVATFLNTLAKSSRIRPYLEHVPVPPDIVKERSVLVEEISLALQNASDLAEKGRLLSSLYLVLPDVPEEEPDWVRAFERLTIAPSEGDITFLLTTLEHAMPVSLLKVSSGGDNLPVAVRPGDTSSLPIAPQYLKRAFTEVKDQFYADRSNANGRLDQGLFHPIPSDFVMELFALGIDNVGLLEGIQTLTAHDVWPFIASSLSVAGTPGPYWFLVRATRDFGQLRSLISKAAKIGNRALKRHATEVIEGTKAIEAKKRLLPSKVRYAKEVLDADELAEKRRRELTKAVSRNLGLPKALTDAGGNLVSMVSDGTLSVGAVLTSFLDGDARIDEPESRRYWARLLCEAASDEEDLMALLRVLRDPELSTAHTAARKAMRLIDQLSYGPDVETTAEC